MAEEFLPPEKREPEGAVVYVIRTSSRVACYECGKRSQYRILLENKASDQHGSFTSCSDHSEAMIKNFQAGWKARIERSDERKKRCPTTSSGK